MGVDMQKFGANDSNGKETEPEFARNLPINRRMEATRRKSTADKPKATQGPSSEHLGGFV